MAVEAQSIEQPEEKSIEDTIRESMASLNAYANAPAAEPAEVVPVEGETTEQTAQRVRDEQGRFAKSGQDARVKPEGEQVQAAPVASQAIKPPDGWTAAAKAEFAKAPPAVQQEVARRESEMHKKFTSQDEDRTFGKRIKETINPYMATIVQEGGTPERAVEELFRTAMILRSPNPNVRRQALQTIAQQFNVDFGVPLQQGASQQATGLQPQHVAQLVQAELQNYRQHQETAQLTSEIDRFAADPANIHFETVKPVMAALLQSGQASDLKDAYDQAIWAKPDIRSTLAAPVSDAESKRLSEARAAADRARRAGGSLTGGPGSAKALNGSGGNVPIEETIRAAIRESSGRV